MPDVPLPVIFNIIPIQSSQEFPMESLPSAVYESGCSNAEITLQDKSNNVCSLYYTVFEKTMSSPAYGLAKPEYQATGNQAADEPDAGFAKP